MRNPIFDDQVDFNAGDRHAALGNVRTFLNRAGYIAPAPLAAMVDPTEFDESLVNAVRKFQRFHGLSDTGTINGETRQVMETPRCGVADLEAGQEVHSPGVSRFVASGGKWTGSNLTYKFINDTPDIADQAEHDILRQAFDAWAEVTPLSFSEVTGSGEADFLISWVSGDHGDGSPFDGPGHVLAHAFFPPPINPHPGIAGDAHFDEAETWSETGTSGTIDLLTVAIHELGHALGLRHSTDNNAIMFPTYSGPSRTLGDDDIEGIQSIYGGPSEESWWQRLIRWILSLFGLGQD